MQLKFKDYDKMSNIVNYLRNYNGPAVKIMEVCGTHTMSIARSGIRTLLSEKIKLISGPGCPVCVTAINRIDEIFELAKRHDTIIATFGDMLKVPGSKAGFNLSMLKSQGANIQIVYSAMDALNLAMNNKENEIIFLGIGFETTAPGTAVAIKEAAVKCIENFSVFSMHKYVEPALRALIESDDFDIDGFLCPGHVSTILGIRGFEFLVEEYKIPSVITGFEAEDILVAIYKILNQITGDNPSIENEYLRIVSYEGNKLAQNMLNEVFYPDDDLWRGIGVINKSGMAIRNKYSKFDAVKKFNINLDFVDKSTACKCGEIIKGKIQPDECKLFAINCTPENPIGPCMVSSEGACAAFYKYLRF
ncbi:Hydrogenase expression/formation protein HypD [Caloramator mitchellensis]|uniref:Hydrogenase expression/formation protein HypD n=1 Tax=Caloramator mitchellensis TaxID=908809 RepID=A0A0R3JSW7_CALMK|nr:hydrogenase formation protein HypD [Caloramator mitchellensis]KRQ86615.1 Hydrogenase expression/formation protein HypD [Caloramator mitchellensis]